MNSKKGIYSFSFMQHKKINHMSSYFWVLLFLCIIFPLTIRSQPLDSTSTTLKGPNPILQSIAGGVIYSTSFFLLGGKSILINYDSLIKNTEFQPISTLVVSSLFAALTVAVIGDLTATHNGGSYLSTLTIDWFASSFIAALSNKIYSGKNESLRFAITLVPSIAILVLMNQLYFDPNEKKYSIQESSSFLESIAPLVGPKFLGINFCKSF